MLHAPTQTLPSSRCPRSKNKWKTLQLGAHALYFAFSVLVGHVMACRLAEGEVKFKNLEQEHADRIAAMSAKMEEASKRAKEHASRADASAFTLEILELR